MPCTCGYEYKYGGCNVEGCRALHDRGMSSLRWHILENIVDTPASALPKIETWHNQLGKWLGFAEDTSGCSTRSGFVSGLPHQIADVWHLQHCDTSERLRTDTIRCSCKSTWVECWCGTSFPRVQECMETHEGPVPQLRAQPRTCVQGVVARLCGEGILCRGIRRREPQTVANRQEPVRPFPAGQHVGGSSGGPRSSSQPARERPASGRHLQLRRTAGKNPGENGLEQVLRIRGDFRGSKAREALPRDISLRPEKSWCRSERSCPRGGWPADRLLRAQKDWHALFPAELGQSSQWWQFQGCWESLCHRTALRPWKPGQIKEHFVRVGICDVVTHRRDIFMMRHLHVWDREKFMFALFHDWSVSDFIWRPLHAALFGDLAFDFTNVLIMTVFFRVRWATNYIFGAWSWICLSQDDTRIVRFTDRALLRRLDLILKFRNVQDHSSGFGAQSSEAYFGLSVLFHPCTYKTHIFVLREGLAGYQLPWMCLTLLASERKIHTSLVVFPRFQNLEQWKMYLARRHDKAASWESRAREELSAAFVARCQFQASTSYIVL